MTADTLLLNTGVSLEAGQKSRTEDKIPWLAALIISGCVLFNFFLCFVNTQGLPISEGHVILSELILVCAAFACGLARPNPERYYWLVVLVAQFVFLALLSVLRDELLLKTFRDVMIMPVFIMFGLAVARYNFTKPLLCLSGFIAAVAIFEAFFLEAFTSHFNIRDYYISKGYKESSFQYIEQDVFVSGIRPGGRFFPFPFEIHRVSSVFLEPVSLGFYAFISGLYFVAMKDRLPKKHVMTAIFLTLVLIWMGDARMAFASLVLLILFRPVFAFLDHRLSLFVFPAALLFGWFVIESGLFNLSGQGLGARVLWTFDGLHSTDEGHFFGLKPYTIDMVDSGFLYLMNYQGIWGFLLYWLPPVFFKQKFTKEARIYWFGATIFLTSGLIISNAIFTIKTASLLWFGYGYIMARSRQALPVKKAVDADKTGPTG